MGGAVCGTFGGAGGTISFAVGGGGESTAPIGTIESPGGAMGITGTVASAAVAVGGLAGTLGALSSVVGKTTGSFGFCVWTGLSFAGADFGLKTLMAP
jgi:hypothetical protein